MKILKKAHSVEKYSEDPLGFKFLNLKCQEQSWNFITFCEINSKVAQYRKKFP